MLGDADKGWIRYCRIMLEWLHPKRNLDPERWVQEVVSRAQALNVDTLLFDMYHGGYAVFDNAVAPKDRHIGACDMLALLDNAVHAQGMRLALMHMGAHAAHFTSLEYPAWRERDAGTESHVPPMHITAQMCLNSPYAGFVRMLRQVIDATSPNTALMVCPGPRPFENDYVDYAAWAPYVDAITHERMWGFGRDHERPIKPKLFELGLSMQVSRAESDKPSLGTIWLGWHVDRDYSPSTAPHYRLNFAEILACGATPQLHAQTIFEVDQSEMKTVREMFDLVQIVRPFLADARLVPFAALVVDYSDFRVSQNMKGFYQALIENHVPFEVISSRDLRLERLTRYKVVVLPNTVRMSERQVEAVKAYHAAGGGVVFTFRTGCVGDNNALRRASPFGAMAGIDGPFGVVTRPSGTAAEDVPHCYYRVLQQHPVAAESFGRLQSFRGSFTKIAATDGTPIAQALDFDYSKMHRHHPAMGWYPGHAYAPMIVVNEPSAGGRVVYSAAEFDREAYELGLPGAMKALAQATVWAASEPAPVTIVGFPMVEMVVHYSAVLDAYTLMLVNQTTNELAEYDAVVARRSVS